MSSIFLGFTSFISTPSQEQTAAAQTPPSTGLLSRIGHAISAPLAATHQSIQNIVDPEISAKIQEILVHSRREVAPYNAAIRTLVTEQSTLDDVKRAIRTVASKTRQLERIPPEGRTGDDYSQLDALNKLASGLDKQKSLLEELETLRSSHTLTTGAMERAQSVRTGLGAAGEALVSTESIAQSPIESFTESFSIDSLLEAAGPAHINLYQQLADGNNALVMEIAGPILREIQSEVSWLTDDKAYEVILHTVLSSVQSFVDKQLVSEEAKSALQNLQVASKAEALLKKQKQLADELHLLENHYIQRGVACDRKDAVKKELEEVQKQIANQLPSYAEQPPNDAYDAANRAFEAAKTSYLTAVTGSEDYATYLDSARAGALDSTTQLLLSRDLNDVPESVLQKIKALIKSVIFHIVRYIVGGLLNGNLTEDAVESLADSAESRIRLELDEITYGAHLTRTHRELIPTVVGIQVKALIPHILKEVPEKLAQFKREARHLDENGLEEYIQTHFRTAQPNLEGVEANSEDRTIENRILSLSSQLVDQLVDADTLGLNVTGSTQIVGFVRSRLPRRLEIESGPIAAGAFAIGRELHRWVGASPMSNLPTAQLRPADWEDEPSAAGTQSHS